MNCEHGEPWSVNGGQHAFRAIMDLGEQIFGTEAVTPHNFFPFLCNIFIPES